MELITKKGTSPVSKNKELFVLSSQQLHHVNKSRIRLQISPNVPHDVRVQGPVQVQVSGHVLYVFIH